MKNSALKKPEHTDTGELPVFCFGKLDTPKAQPIGTHTLKEIQDNTNQEQIALHWLNTRGWLPCA